MTECLDALKERMAELADLLHFSSLANWDQQTMMPPQGAGARAQAMATLRRVTHKLLVDDETGRLLDGAETELSGRPYEDDDVSLVRLVRRRYEKARRVPAELAAELTRAASVGHEAWVAARRDSDFQSFIPHLELNLELARRYVDCHLGHDSFECAYDVVLDDYEPQMKTATVAELFEQLRLRLVPLIAEIARHPDAVDDRMLHLPAPIEGQRALVSETVRRLGFDDRGWRLDDTVHPFATCIGLGDVRITTRWDERFFPMALFGAIHEFGHGLYESQIPAALRRSPLGRGTSLGVHESQSRMWENMVGRGRAFGGVLAGMVSSHLGATLGEVDPDAFHRAVNHVAPSFIRVEADEATYALHIILRFELEQQLLEGTLAVRDLPEAWNERVANYLGLEVRDDADGVLQDVHWSSGLIGYFPTYALGNLIAGQLWEAALNDLPDRDAQLAAGETEPLRAWLGERVHRHGSKLTTTELLDREGLGPITVEPFLDYLTEKLARVYPLTLPG